MHPDWIVPDWPAPAGVRALVTSRAGGVSQPPYASMNLAAHVGDDAAAVAENRRILRQSLPAEPLWLQQVHGTRVVELCLPPAAATVDARVWQTGPLAPEADASFTRQAGQVCAVLTADCLPVLFCDRGGTVVAAAHAGWRGLAGGVLEATVAAMAVAPADILAWLGPAIGADRFEVGPEVRQIFVEYNPLAGIAFRPALPGTLDEAPRKWLADLGLLARIRLADVGVERVYADTSCTYRDAGRFFSYRRDGCTGRMASLIWLE